MRRVRCFYLVVVLFIVVSCTQPSVQETMTGFPTQPVAEQLLSEGLRSVAITFDDLPVVGGRNFVNERRITNQLLDQIATHEIPTTGFVIGSALDSRNKAALLERWLEAGHQLGNHTYSHPSLHDIPLADYVDEVSQTDALLTSLLQQWGQEPLYFRHPFLHAGNDIETKQLFEQFLSDQGYSVAPVTIDNDEYLYASAYNIAISENDQTLAARIGEDYVRYMEEMFVFYEQFSIDFLGREPAQILLLHANALNAHYLGDLAEMLKGRGYWFVSLDDALEDSVYDLPDEYVGSRGLSWLVRWWISQGNEPVEQPKVPVWVRELTD